MATQTPSVENEDMFLELTLAKSGKVNGESTKDGHLDQMEIAGWSWGMQSKTAMGGGGAAGKATVNELRVHKFFDRASTAIMAGLRQNDTVKKAVVYVRKAGGKPVDYLSCTIENGRLTGYDVRTEGPRPIEVITFSFRKITIEYKQQRPDGGAGGSMQYIDEIASTA